MAATSVQLSLVPLPKQTLLDRVHAVLRGYQSQWLTAWQVQQEVEAWCGIYASESSISARLRELRQVGVNVVSRRRSGARVYEYQLGGQRA
jgi:hypothetical protein